MGGGMSVMGVGNSRPNAGEAVAVPPRVRPILVRRFEEMKKRKGASKLPVEGTLSKKKLLKEDTEEDDSTSQSSHETYHETKKEDKVSTKEVQQAKEEIEVRVIAPEKLSRVVPLPNSECEAVEEKHNDQVETKAETEERETTEPKQESEQDVDAKSDYDSDYDEIEEFSRLLPGSPSFRIYCIEAEKTQEEECEKQIIAIHKKAPSIESVQTAASEPEHSRKLTEVLPAAETESTAKRKGKKTKKFRVVRILFSVKSCYHPMCSCTGDQGRHVVAAKAAN